MAVGLVIFKLLVGVLLLLLVLLELWWRRRPADQLSFTVETWGGAFLSPSHYHLEGKLLAHNQNTSLEVTLATLTAELQLLGQGPVQELQTEIKVWTPESSRSDNYWVATILSPQSSLPVKITVDIRAPQTASDLSDLQLLQVGWLRLHYHQYGRQLRQLKTKHVIWPLQAPIPNQERDWQEIAVGKRLAIRTHLLNPQDSLTEILATYVKPWAQPGDYVAIAESATAIVEGHFRHPTDLTPGWLARRLCYFFPSKTSLSSAYGFQALVDSSSPWRVAFAFGVGAIAKILGRPGVFYQLAGPQAALIDDVTGTLPPYDQFLVYGPADPDRTVTELHQATGLQVAIVDVNDLREVKILAASSGIDAERLKQALRDNPAGNAAEQTPLVLIRPI